jgi:DNA recombination protein RmuC
MEIVTLIIGLTVGILATRLLLNKRFTDAGTIARNQGQLELALLNERLNSATGETKRLTAELTESERQLRDMRQQQETIKGEIAQLSERSKRIPLLEQELKVASTSIEQQNHQISALRQKMGSAESKASSQIQEISRLSEELQLLSIKRDQLLLDLQNQTNLLTETSTMLDAERRQNEEKLTLLNDAREQLSNQFKALANDILEEKAKRFTEQNQTNIGQLLEPLKLKLTEFQGKVEEVYVQEGKERSALATQVKHLMDLNKVLSDEAHNLTRALKGSSKTQGNWGEMILEKILESSGLRKGHEYDVQESHTRDDGSRVQPDVIIHLPEERHIIIDAKVSLNGYEECVNANDETARDAALKRHIDSVRGHIKELATKNYQDLHGVKSLDFVLMFVPIEPAFMLAISQENNLWQDAWKRNVLLVSPSTLLFVVRTVAHLWRQEQQNRNAQEIAKRGAELYDKLTGFVEDLKSVGNRINQAQNEYDKAYGKLVSGRGNLIRQAEMLRELGIKPGKSLPQEVLDASFESSGPPI